MLTQSLSSVASMGAKADPNAKLKAQAKGLEGVFLNTLMSQMFSSIKTDGAFGGGFAEQTWRGMQSEQFADNLAQSGGIGLADQITRNLLDAQEAAQASHPPASSGASK